MLLGVYFGDKHTFKDWGLIQETRPVVSPPEVKKKEIDIPGADGILDLTTALTGDVKYENRQMRFEFTILDDRDRWHRIYSDILDYLHGQEMKIILDEDPAFYYVGRVSVNEWESDETISRVVIEAGVHPYKMELTSSLEMWEWDSFDLDDGIIREYEEIIVDGSYELEIMAMRKVVIPVIHSTAAMKVIFNDETYDLKVGYNKIREMQIKDGRNVLSFIGKGKVSVDYRGGRL